jgi:Uma2 family endonuclease
MSGTSKPYVTYADYLALEEDSDLRWAWLDGEVWAMSGGSPVHSELTTNVTLVLGAALRGRPCRPYDANLRVRVPASGMAFHPDVSVVCGPRQLDTEDPNAVTNPTVIVEVLSKSTERYDRTDKLVHYRRIPSLRDYLLVSQTEVRVEHYRRNDDGTWTLRDVRDGESVALASLDVTLAIDDVYAGVTLPSSVTREHPSPTPQDSE